MSKSLILKPRLNEKTYSLSTGRVYVFDVDKSANKHLIARAVEAQFDVKVVSVNTTTQKGKLKRTMSLNGKRMKNSYGHRSTVKRAYVTLAEGNSLPFFEAVEESEQKEQVVQEKLKKAAEKAEKPTRRGIRLPGKKAKSTEEEK